MTVGQFMLKEASILLFLIIQLILLVWLIIMVSGNSTTSNKSFGLLPSPKSPPISGLQADKYVGSSTYPLPYDAVVVLEGCSIENLLSWDISVSSKAIKVKIEWSCQPNNSNGCVIQEKVPKNLIKALRLHDLARPLWSLTSSSSKISIRFEWSIPKAVLQDSSMELPPLKQKLPPTCLPAYKTPSQPVKNIVYDSGYKSFNSTVGCYDPKIQNWRQHTSPVSNPKFDPSLRNVKHDVFITSKSSNKSTSKAESSSSQRNLEISTPALIINSEHTLATVNNYPDPLKSDHVSSVEALRASSSKEIDQNMSSKPSKLPSPESSMSTDQMNASKTSPSSPNISLINNRDANSTTLSHSKAISDVDSENSSDDDIPTPPPGFPKVFYPTPKPLPLMKDGFLPPTSKAYYMNIPGICRLCDKKVSSYLIDVHLLQCSELDRQSLDHFVKSVMKKTKLKRKQIVEASKQYNGFELDEKTVPNKYFKNSSDYKFFRNELENLTLELVRLAFHTLNIPVEYENFNLLKYTG